MTASVSLFERRLFWRVSGRSLLSYLRDKLSPVGPYLWTGEVECVRPEGALRFRTIPVGVVDSGPGRVVLQSAVPHGLEHGVTPHVEVGCSPALPGKGKVYVRTVAGKNDKKYSYVNIINTLHSCVYRVTDEVDIRVCVCFHVIIHNCETELLRTLYSYKL